MGRLRAGILEARALGGSGLSAGVGRMRAGTLEARSLGGGSGPLEVGRMRAGTLEARSLGGSPATMSPVQCLAPTLVLFQNAIMIFICLLLFLQISVFKVIIIIFC